MDWGIEAGGRRGFRGPEIGRHRGCQKRERERESVVRIFGFPGSENLINIFLLYYSFIDDHNLYFIIILNMFIMLSNMPFILFWLNYSTFSFPDFPNFCSLYNC